MAAFISSAEAPAGRYDSMMASFPAFLFGEFGAVALGELVDGFLALLQDRLQQLNGLRLVELADFFDFLELDGGFDRAAR